MGNQVVVVKKKSTFWKVVKILLAVGALCLIAAKVYRKFFQKNTEVVVDEDADEATDVDLLAEEDADVEEEAFEVPAEAVIANAEDMEDGEAVAEE